MKRLLIVITILLILSLLCFYAVYGATSGAFEYNDFNLFGTNGTLYASGAFRSDNGGPMETFVIGVNVNTNQWWITGGTWSNIPFPTGITIDYTDNSTFLQNAYITVNGQRISFTIVSGGDSSGIFYSRTIEASPNYPVVNVYLPTNGTAVSVPNTPIIAFSDGWITWDNPNGYTYEVYMSTSANLAGDLQDRVTGQQYKVREGKDGYYYTRIRYSVNGEYRYTDYSNRVYGSYVANAGEGEDGQDLEWWAKILKFFADIMNGIRNARDTVMHFIEEVGGFVSDLLSWLPQDITSVFYAVIVIGLVLGLFLK